MADKDQDYTAAVTYYTKAIKSSRDNWEKAMSYQYRGKIFVKIGEFENALQDFSSVISLGEISGFLNRGDLYIKINEYDKAILDYSEYIKKADSSPLGFIHRGDLYITVNEITLSRADYDEAFLRINNRTYETMNNSLYETWKYMMIKYREYFQIDPSYNQAIINIIRPNHGNIIVSQLNNMPVNWQNSFISIPANRYSLKVQYIVSNVNVNKETSFEGVRNPDDLNITNLGTRTLTTTTTTTTTFTTTFTDRQFLSGHVYKIDANRNGDIFISDVTIAEGIITTSRQNKAQPANVPRLTGGFGRSGDYLTPKVGGTIRVTTDNIGGEGILTLQWLRDNTEINGATDASYTLTDLDVGKIITVRGIREGYSGIVTWATAYPVLPADAPRLTGRVTINGILEVGQTIMVDTSLLSGTGEILFQWMRKSGAYSYTHINAMSMSYTVTNADVQAGELHVRVIRSGNYGQVTGSISTENQ